MSTENFKDSKPENSQEKKQKYNDLIAKSGIIVKEIVKLAKNENYTSEEINTIVKTLEDIFTEAKELASEDPSYYGAEDIKHELYMKIDSTLKGVLKGSADADKGWGMSAASKNKEHGPYNQKAIDIWNKIDETLKERGIDLIEFPEK
ncbi:MAG: hypothetical protein PHU56_03730 [Candidatus Pacebacteria bacterium]|nr:hypothetical protein [Candidatus Paceibacterota bacterium]